MKKHWKIIYLVCLPLLVSTNLFGDYMPSEAELNAYFTRDPRFKYIFVAKNQLDGLKFKDDVINIPSDRELKKITLEILEDYQHRTDWGGNPDAKFIQDAYDILLGIEPRFDGKIEVLKNYLINDPVDAPVDLGDLSSLSVVERIDLLNAIVDHTLSRMPRDYDVEINTDEEVYTANSQVLTGEQIMSLGVWVVELGTISHPNAEMLYRNYAEAIYNNYDNKLLWSFVKYLSQKDPDFLHAEIFEEIAPADETPEFKTFLKHPKSDTEKSNKKANEKLSLSDLKQAEARPLPEARLNSEALKVAEPAEVDLVKASEQSPQWWLWFMGALVVLGGLAVVVRRKS